MKRTFRSIRSKISSRPSSRSNTPTPAQATPPPAQITGTGDQEEGIGTIALDGMKEFLRVLKESSDAFAPLKAAVGGIVAIMDINEVRACRSVSQFPLPLIFRSIQRMESNREEIITLTDSMNKLMAILAQQMKREVGSDCKSTIAALAEWVLISSGYTLGLIGV